MRRWHRRFQGWLWILLLTAMVPGFAWAAGTISGTVVEDQGGAPIPYANVNIYTDRCHNGHLFGTQTDASGYFEFTGLSENQQFILMADVYGAGPYYISQWYDDLSDYADCNQATFVSVGATVNFRLDPGGAVSGSVKDSSGNDITGVAVGVNVFSGDPCGYYQWYGGTWTDHNNGTFTILGIPAGTYFLRTYPAESDYIDTWWNSSYGSENCGAADSFPVTTGQMASGFEFRLNQGGRVTGRVTRESDGQPIANVWVEAHHYGSNAWGNGANTDDEGFYEIIGLPSDDYRIFIYPGGMNYLEEYYDDSHDYNTANRVSVSAGQTTSNIHMALD